MGKSIIWSGITVDNPIRNVIFKDGISAKVRGYLSKLSVSVSNDNKLAFQEFYDTLNSANLWDKIFMLYPCFGSVKDCGKAWVGEDIKIPQGAEYDKGLKLKNAYGGAGALGRGIVLSNNLLSDAYSAYSTLYNQPYDFLPTYEMDYGGDVFVFCETEVPNSDDGVFMGIFSGHRLYAYYFMYDYPIGAKITSGVSAFTFDNINSQTRLYKSGELLKTNLNSMLSHHQRFGINIWSNELHNLTIPVNMLMVFKSVLTNQDVIEITNAINLLAGKIGLINQ